MGFIHRSNALKSIIHGFTSNICAESQPADITKSFHLYAFWFYHPFAARNRFLMKHDFEETVLLERGGF
jgi:hypothetical protein